jgi:hypothetical protein
LERKQISVSNHQKLERKHVPFAKIKHNQKNTRGNPWEHKHDYQLVLASQAPLYGAGKGDRGLITKWTEQLTLPHSRAVAAVPMTVEYCASCHPENWKRKYIPVSNSENLRRTSKIVLVN